MNEHINAKTIVPAPAAYSTGNSVAVRALQIATIIGEVLLSA